MVSTPPPGIAVTSVERSGSRDAILQAVRAARPPAVARPEPFWPAVRASNGSTARDVFTAAATAAGAAVVACPRGDLPRVLAGAVGAASSTLSFLEGVPSTVAPAGDPHLLDTLDVVVCESMLGVAENGAVWIATSDSTLRAALFLAMRVVITIAEEHLVADLHQAYERIDLCLHTFGAFIAGPSKTADIEQSLVIGAHGPKELTIVLVSVTTPDEIGAA
jgi:L-lactate dehydrogenase complex protein LldG